MSSLNAVENKNSFTNPFMRVSARTKATITKIALIAGSALTMAALLYGLISYATVTNMDLLFKVTSLAMIAGIVFSFGTLIGSSMCAGMDKNWLVDKFSDPPPKIVKYPYHEL